MRIKRYAQGKFYRIECSEGTRVVRRSEQFPDGSSFVHDLLVVPLNGRD